MDKWQYRSLLMWATPTQIIKALRDLVGAKCSVVAASRKIIARSSTKDMFPTGTPSFVFTSIFFAKLQLMPAVSLNVVDSRSKIRRECYGFREHRSGERVYLKIDGDSVLEFRDGIAGYLCGKRYFIPGLDRMYEPKTWRKVNRLMGRMLSKQGIIAKGRDYTADADRRKALTLRMIELILNYWGVHGSHLQRKSRKKHNEKANNVIP